MNVNFLVGALILALTGTVLPVVDRFLRMSRLVSLIVASASYVVSIGFLLADNFGGFLFENFFSTDEVSTFIGLLILIASWMTAIVILKLFESDKFVNELIATLMISTVGALFLISSENFISLFISMELMTLPTYLMVLFAFDDDSIEAGVKYFFNGALAAGLVLFGISLLYGFTGDFSFSSIGKNLFNDPIVAIAVVLIIAGIGFKLTAVPFHFWGPDVYDGTYPGIAAIITGLSKSAAFIALLRIVFEALPALSHNLSLIFAVLAVLTMTVGNLLALAQKRVSRILAYSSVAHAGYTLIGFAALSTSISITGIVYHSVAYVFMKTAAFLAFAAMLYIWGARTMDDYRGLGRREPVLALLFFIFLLSLAGVPPLAGFMSKLFVFTAAVKAGMTWLALIGLLNSAFSVAYYIWIAKQMYLEEPVLEKPVNEVEHKSLILVPLAVFAVALVILGVWINPVLGISSTFAAKVGF